MLLKEARERAKLTRAGLSRKAGVSERQIYDIEHNRCEPRRATMAVLAVAVGCRRDEIDWPTAIKEAA